MRLDTNWILQEPIDLEHKQYVLLDYINKVDKDFDDLTTEDLYLVFLL